MSTSFSDLHPAIRALVVDDNASAYMYSVSTINEHIRLIIQSEENISVEESDPVVDPPVFSSVVSTTNQILIKLKAARSIISGVPNDFAYKSPVMMVRRKGLTNQILANIQRILASVEGRIHISSESEIDAYFTASLRSSDAISSVPSA